MGLCIMDKGEFAKLVKPLSHKELLYKDHPELSEEFYLKSRTITRDSDGVYVFNTHEQLGSGMHGEIYPGQTAEPIHQNIRFAKQTRFSRVPMHRHRWVEMNYMYSGSCTAIINSEKIPLKAGDVCILDVEVVHTIEPTGEKDVILNCLMLPRYFNTQFIGHLANSGIVAQFLAEVLSDKAAHDKYLLFHTANVPLIRELIEGAFCEYLDSGLCSTDMLDSYMTQLFIQLARCYQEDKEQEYHRNSRSYITEILRYIEEHCNDCTLTEVAKHFNFHPNALSRTLKNATGFSFQELVAQNRLMTAAFLLTNSPLPVSEIAFQCGWSNQTQFYKKFTEGFGCTPREYRLRQS